MKEERGTVCSDVVGFRIALVERRPSSYNCGLHMWVVSVLRDRVFEVSEENIHDIQRRFDWIKISLRLLSDLPERLKEVTNLFEIEPVFEVKGVISQLPKVLLAESLNMLFQSK